MTTIKKVLGDFLRFWRDFRSGWLLLLLIVFTSYFGCAIGVRIALVLFLIYIAFKPMNAVYGLIGTKGNITHFIRLIIVINVFFFLVYYFGFFRDAGITFDTSQPYVSYGMFKGGDKDANSFTKTLRHEIRVVEAESRYYSLSPQVNTKGQGVSDTIEIVIPAKTTISYYEEAHTYYRLPWWNILQHTFLTSLMQEPSDLFTNCISYFDDETAEHNLNGIVDQDMSRLFSWVLILQVFISWIFFGVFISILYNKFRYES